MSNRKAKGQKMKKAIILWGFLLFLVPTLLSAKEFPTKPINLVVLSVAGGNLDVSFRSLASPAEKLLGQPFIISNNAAGGGSVALGVFAKQKADGYYLAACPSSSLVRVPHLRPVLYKLEDFTPILQFASDQAGLVVRADSPWKTLKEFVEYAKKNPGKVTYTTFGVGSSLHVAMVYIAKQEGIHWTMVPTPGSLPHIPLLGGHVTACSGTTAWSPHVKSGALRLLATYGEKRMKAFPEVPTLRELGYDFIQDTVFVVLAPKGTPPSIVKKLDETFHKAMDDRNFNQILDKLEIEGAYLNSADSKKYLQESYTRIGKMMVDLQIPRETEKK